jgi:hypothetical protein
LNYEINEKVFSKLNEIEIKKFAKKADQAQPKNVLNIFPEDRIMTDKEAVKYIKSKTFLDEDVIVNSLNTLLQDKKLIGVYDRKQNLHLRKMRRLY